MNKTDVKMLELLNHLGDAFYTMANVAEENLPDHSYDGDEDVECWIQETLDHYDQSLSEFQENFSALERALTSQDGEFISSVSKNSEKTEKTNFWIVSICNNVESSTPFLYKVKGTAEDVKRYIRSRMEAEASERGSLDLSYGPDEACDHTIYGGNVFFGSHTDYFAVELSDLPLDEVLEV